MNIAKRVCLILLTLVFLFSFTGCAASQKQDGKSLREHGMDVIRIMEEMVKNTEYGELFGTGMGELEEIRMSLAAGDYTAPLAVYEVNIPDIGNVMALLGEDSTLKSFSDSLKSHLNNRSSSVLISQVNAMQGVAYVAASSIYTTSKTFVSSELKENTLYLYTFQNGYTIAVTFIAGEDHSVTATGTFLLSEDFQGNSMEEIGALLKNAGITGALKQVPDIP